MWHYIYHMSLAYLVACWLLDQRNAGLLRMIIVVNRDNLLNEAQLLSLFSSYYPSSLNLSCDLS
jgi:hypothetical protein